MKGERIAPPSASGCANVLVNSQALTKPLVNAQELAKFDLFVFKPSWLEG